MGDDKHSEPTTVLQHLQQLYTLFLASPAVMAHYPILTLTPASPSSSMSHTSTSATPPIPIPTSSSPPTHRRAPSQPSHPRPRTPSRPSRPSTPTQPPQSPRLHQRRRLALPSTLPLPPIPPSLVNSPYLSSTSPFTKREPAPLPEACSTHGDVLGLGDTVPMLSPALSASSSSPPTTPEPRPVLARSPSGVWLARSPLGADSPGAMVAEAMEEYFCARVIAERKAGSRRNSLRQVPRPQPPEEE